jgi:hypothetical protein
MIHCALNSPMILSAFHFDLQASKNRSQSDFVKFHSNDRMTFERHVKARWKFGCHRHDPIARNDGATRKEIRAVTKKWEAKERHLRNRLRGRRRLETCARRN